ncbi:MAG: DUF4815 domain-containing protein [Candidatus Peribacteraceae bacterium]|nr:DUF4815 domain-containing protein [Candidatus Peribacteraceae bacterium]
MTDLNISPYFDDYDDDKGFLQVLFRATNPGTTVQARELTQLQTILQNQISRMGDNLFKEGALVIGSGINIHNNHTVLKLSISTAFSAISDTDDLYVRSVTTGMHAKVQYTVNADTFNPISTFIEYIDSGSDYETTDMVATESVIFYTVDPATGTETDVSTGTITEVTQGSWCNVGDAIFYVNGFFVKSQASKIVLDIYGTTPTYRIGFLTTDSIVTDEDDESLKSNALGTSNYLSSGAHRLKTTLTLTTLGIGNEQDSGFVEVGRIENGIVTTLVLTTDYNLLGDELARRTYEESGNYTVNPFTAEIRQQLRSGTNGGLYQAVDGGDATKLAFGISPGIAYVKGYRTENIATEYVDINKARDTESVNNAGASALYGLYVDVSGLHSYPTIDVTLKLDLHDASIVGGASAGNIIGTARVRSVSYTDSDTIRVHLFDVSMNTGKTFSDVIGVRYSDADNLFGGDLDASTLVDTGVGHRSVVFPLPYSAINTLKESGVDTTYTVMREFNGTTNGSGDISFSVGADELFDSVSPTTFYIAESGSGNGGTLVTVSGSTVNLTGSPTGKSVALTLGGGFATTIVKMIAPVIKQQPSEKTKTSIIKVDTLAISGSSLTLTKADGYILNSIVDTTTSQVITEQFEFDNGQRDNFYDLCSISTINGTTLDTTLQVTYQYFSHSVGDYFSVDSYSGIDYETIPSYIGTDGVEIQLRDAIDFRPLKNSSGGFDSTVGELIKPNSTIRADIQFYLPRIDSIYVNQYGDFSVVEGISSTRPVAPEAPSDSMKLFDVTLDPYTFGVENLLLMVVDNKRYTMRDIGKLDTRIGNLEYYTSLNLLEAKADSIEVVDPATGNTRFKNGFVTDGFTDFRLGEVENIEWEGSIDPEAGLFYPSFTENAVDMTVSSGSGYKVLNDLIMLDWTHEESTKQPYATRSHNVNPFAVFTWLGRVTLNPETDFWRDVKYNDPIQTNVTVNTRGAARRGVVRRSNWNSIVTTTTTFTDVTRTSMTDTLISSELIPWMRSIDIDFNARGMRPYTTVYPFFNNDNVTVNVKPLAGSYGDTIITDKAGEVNGTFTVPTSEADRFRTGTNSFRLVDSTDNSFDITDITTSAQANHTSRGILDTRQQTILSTRILGARTTTRTWRNPDQDEPIAQSFMVSQLGGEFITKVDIYFETKSNKDIPIRLQLRTVENGYPTGVIIPFGEAWLNPDDITISADASVATPFVFDDPVYLQNGVEYALVLIANTQEYNVFIAEMGGTVLGARETVAKQPSLGSFFISQNATTWTAEQTMDLTFTLYRAKFDTVTPGIVEFQNATPEAWIVGTNPLYATDTSTAITVEVESHGLKAGDNVVISGATDGNGQTSTEINKTHTVTSVTNIDEFVITSSATSTATGGFGGSVCSIIHNYPISSIYNNMAEIGFDNTTADWEYQAKTQAARGMTTYAPFISRSEVSIPEEMVVIAQGDLLNRVTMNTTVDNLSPVIDLDGLTSALTSNRINSDTTDEDVTGLGKAKCKYIIKTVGFDNPSTAAKMYIGAFLPDSALMEIHYKLVVDDENIADKDWVQVSTIEPITNDDANLNEYSALIDSVGSFSGIKMKIILASDDVINVPILRDFRLISLA